MTLPGVIMGSTKKGRGIVMKNNVKKIVMASMFVFLICALFTCFAARVNARRAKDEDKYARFVYVNYGDTLTSIAESNYSSEYESVEKLIDEIKKINHIYGETIYAGDKLIVPYYVH